ncbi:MAG: hypothetical protein WAQ52_15320 [Terriglobales bacterium]
MKSNRSEYLPVIQKLLERTQQGRVQWQGGLGTFYCSLGSERESTLKFTLSSIATQDINHDMRFLVMEDINGDPLFRVESNDLPTSAEEEEISNLINELYDLARRQALKVDQKLELASSLLDRV